MGSLDSLIAAARSAGSAAHPTIEIDDTTLRTALGPLADREPAHLADLYLAIGCLANLPAAIAAFEATQMGVVERTVRKAGGGADDVDEVRQHVRTVVLVDVPGTKRALANYRGDGPLGSWVRVVAMREAYRRLRARKGIALGGDEQMFELMAASDEAEPEVRSMKASYREAFHTAFRGAIAALPRRERAALRFNVLDGLSIDAIGEMYGVHRATAARWLANARDEVSRATRAAMMASLGMSEGEVDSVLRMIESRLDASIATAGARE